MGVWKLFEGSLAGIYWVAFNPRHISISVNFLILCKHKRTQNNFGAPRFSPHQFVVPLISVCAHSHTEKPKQKYICICTWVLVTQSCGCGNVCVLRAVKVCSTLRMSVYSIVKVFVCHVTLNPFVSEKIMLFIKVVD